MEWLAGLGIRAFLGGAIKRAWAFARSIPWQIWLALALAALIAWLAIGRAHALEHARASDARNAAICAQIRRSAARPRQDCRLAELQIQAFAASIAELDGALADQNARIRELGRKNAQLQSEAQAAKRQAASRAAEADSVAARLKASSSKAPAQPCPVSNVLEEQWK